jgi:hypothetical protein
MGITEDHYSAYHREEAGAVIAAQGDLLKQKKAIEQVMWSVPGEYGHHQKKAKQKFENKFLNLYLVPPSNFCQFLL